MLSVIRQSDKYDKLKFDKFQLRLLGVNKYSRKNLPRGEDNKQDIAISNLDQSIFDMRYNGNV